MSDNIVSHPHRDLMAEAKREREVADSAEGQVLQQAICKAVNAYSEFLDPADPDWPRMKAQALVIILDYGKCRGIEIQLKDGALDRVYGNGVNPDPAGFGPHDIQHKHRNDD